MNNKLIKISVIGNSVAIRVRPPQKYPDNQNYTQLLEEKLNLDLREQLVLINSIANGGDTVNDMLSNLDHYIRSFPNFYILNIGVVDASTREIPKCFFNIINNKKEGFCRNFLKLLYNGIIKKQRRLIVLLSGKRTWISKSRFRKAYTTLVSNLIKETNARIITLSINKGNSRIEKEVPGSIENYTIYSEIIKEISEQYGASYISLDDLESDSHFPDGVHFSKEGHEIVAEKLAAEIKHLLKQ